MAHTPAHHQPARRQRALDLRAKRLESDAHFFKIAVSVVGRAHAADGVRSRPSWRDGDALWTTDGILDAAGDGIHRVHNLRDAALAIALAAKLMGEQLDELEGELHAIMGLTVNNGGQR
jgi:hypothetical protein